MEFSAFDNISFHRLTPAMLHLADAIPVFQPGSPQAEAISDLFWWILAICGAIFAVVTGLVVYCIVGFRRGVSPAEPHQVKGHFRLELVWTVIPFLLVVWMFLLTARGMIQSNPGPTRDPDLVIVGHQFWWEVRYPPSGVVTANEIHIPIGKKLLVRLDSADVIHDFWVPQLAPKMDVVPGRPNYIWLEARSPGVYLGACSEFCGVQHAWMRFRIIAESPADFEAWQNQQLESAPIPSTPGAAEGRRLFEQMTCANCHAVKGTSATSEIGPDLTHVASRPLLGAGVITNNPSNLALWIRNTQAIKTGSLMPQMELTDEQLHHLVEYFLTLK